MAERQKTAADQRGSWEGRVEHSRVAAAPLVVGEGDRILWVGDKEAVRTGEKRSPVNISDCECLHRSHLPTSSEGGGGAYELHCSQPPGVHPDVLVCVCCSLFLCRWNRSKIKWSNSVTPQERRRGPAPEVGGAKKSGPKSASDTAEVLDVCCGTQQSMMGSEMRFEHTDAGFAP